MLLKGSTENDKNTFWHSEKELARICYDLIRGKQFCININIETR